MQRPHRGRGAGQRPEDAVIGNALHGFLGHHLSVLDAFDSGVQCHVDGLVRVGMNGYVGVEKARGLNGSRHFSF